MRKWLLKSPTLDEFLRLLMAWRVWCTGALVGAALASVLYFLLPPQYRARATVLVDQHSELVIPQLCTDRELYTFLQRETDKLVEIAWSDAIMQEVASHTGLPVAELRDGRLHLDQPSDGGWHFYADASDTQTASRIASAWGEAFVESAASHPAGVNPLLEVNYTQAEDLPVSRAVGPGVVVFAGSLAGAALLAFGLLFLDRRDA